MKNILKRIKPSKTEEYLISKIANNFLNKLKTEETIPVLGGSTAKGTWLKGDHDIDVFVKFKTEKNISERLEELLKSKFRKVTKVHGSRDYFHVIRFFITFEVIPILDIEDTKDAKNITDCSPFHAEWTRKHMTDKMRDETRLLKQFCKAQKVYGAETHIKGFSGHVLELLIIHYKSFKNVLKAATKWKKGTVIKFIKKTPKLNKSKISSLILIDPTEPNRNAAAALSEEKFKKFIKSSKEYLKNPSNKFFHIKEITEKDLKDKDVIIKVWPINGKKDIVATKLLKTYEFISKNLEEYGFKIKESDIEIKNGKPSLIYFDFKNKTLPKEYKHYGPSAKMKSHAEEFCKIHKKVHIHKGRLYTLKEREYTKVEDFLKKIIEEDYIKERVKKVKIV